MKTPHVVLLLALASLSTGAQAQTNLVPRWTKAVSGLHVRHGAAIGNDGIIYVTADGSPTLLHALKPDGSFIWTYTGANGNASAPTLAWAAIYYGVL